MMNTGGPYRRLLAQSAKPGSRNIGVKKRLMSPKANNFEGNFN